MPYARLLAGLTVTVYLSFGVVTAQHLRINVSNTLGVDRMSEPVVIAWSDVRSRLKVSEPSRLRLIDEDRRSLAFQVDDLNADGQDDELSFACNISAHGRRTFMLTLGADSLATGVGPLRTDAANYKRIGGVSSPVDDDDGPGTLRSQGQYPFDGVGWESELIGYRLYLDERNAIDIQAKRQPGLHWNFIGRSRVDYQLDAYWGMDVLHVGPSFGFGGIAIVGDGTTVKPFDLTRRRTRILSRGPVRVVVLVEYTGWKVGDQRLDLSSTFIQYAGDRMTEHRLEFRGPTDVCEVATGIVRHTKASVTVDPKRGILVSIGAQSRATDSLLMVLAIPSEHVTRTFQTDVDDGAVFRVTRGVPVRMMLSAAWQGEPEGHSILRDGGSAERERVLARLTAPLQLEIQSSSR